MVTEIHSKEPANSALPAPAPVPRAVKAWPAILLVAVYWAAHFSVEFLELSNFSKLLVRAAVLGVLLVLFFTWWLIQRSVPRRERWILFASTLLMGVAAGFSLHPSVLPPVVIFLALPSILTAWAVWLALVRNQPVRVRRVGMLAIAAIAWIATLLVRMDGLSGGTTAVFHWRWSTSSEERFLAERMQGAASSEHQQSPSELALPLVAADGDWPEFRGGSRDAVVTGVKIATNWNDSPPEKLWRRRVGPGWSSMSVVGNRLFTQEQRADFEAVICVNVANGNEIWAHEDKTRFSEMLGGDGPRATPTFAEGKIYALGATGILNCLDANTGRLHWTRNIARDSGASLPMWGFCSSPQVVDGRVVVFAGREGDESLLAYSALSGDIVWKGGRGTHSYASPQLATIAGSIVILFVSDVELSALDPATGKTVWSFPGEVGQGQSSIQAHAINPTQLAVSFSPEVGTALLNVGHQNGQWQTDAKWSTMNLKPFFNDFVYHDGSIYGFDNAIFSCVDVETGKRRWKGGRYGTGQVLLLADQAVLLILSEKGEAVLVAADPSKHRELGRFQAIDGKTWNHPTVVGDKLYVRNAEEMACYRLKLVE